MKIQYRSIKAWTSLLCVTAIFCTPASLQAQVLTPINAFMTDPHNPRGEGIPDEDTIEQAFAVLTDGITLHEDDLSGEEPVRNRVDTFNSDNTSSVLDFVGLEYENPARFDSITIELGRQFRNGGDWEAQPKIYILKNRTLVGRLVEPQLSGNWVEVTGYTETTGHTFNPAVVEGSGGTINFDLSGVPAADRTGWAWAVGGVDGNSDPLNLEDRNFISLTEAFATGVAAAAPPIPLPLTPQPVNIVASAYNGVKRQDDGMTNSRGSAYSAVRDGVATEADNSSIQVSGFDTFNGDLDGIVDDFVGLQYGTQVEFDTIRIDLGEQYSNGGDWDDMPDIYILKNPVDTNTDSPADDPTNWQKITGFTEESEHTFAEEVNTGGDTPTIVFDLTSINAEDRTGYGWAVLGDGNSDPFDPLLGMHFVSVSELSATGTVIAPPGLTGDFDGNGTVDGADFLKWQTEFGISLDASDLADWEENFGTGVGALDGVASVPEPTGLILGIAAVLATALGPRPRRHG